MIVDKDRRFERAMGVPEISLQNIYQARIITSNGKLERGSSGNFAGSIQAALQGATWKIDPSRVPQGLHDEWKSHEFSELSANEANTEFHAAVMHALKRDESRFWSLGKNGNRAGAYTAFLQMKKRFEGKCKLSPKVIKAGLWLEERPELKTLVARSRKKALLAEEARESEEQAKRADKAFRYARELAAAGGDEKKRARIVLRRIVKSYPETDVAQQAEAMLEQMNKR